VKVDDKRAFTTARLRNCEAKPEQHLDFVAFLNKVNREVPAELDIHVILDNLATHKTPRPPQRQRTRRRHQHLSRQLELQPDPVRLA